MRINFYGGPGSGKSTTAPHIFSALKRLNHSVELATEFVKPWTYTGRTVKAFDQVFLMGSQMQEEYQYLANGVKHTVTDSPVFLSYIYAKSLFPEAGIHQAMKEISLAYERSHPSINIFLNRGDKPYRQEGRWQTKEEAIELDEKVLGELLLNNIDYRIFRYGDDDAIVSYIDEEIRKRHRTGS